MTKEPEKTTEVYDLDNPKDPNSVGMVFFELDNVSQNSQEGLMVEP